MLGAGFSYEIKNNNGKILGDAVDLTKYLCEKYSIPYDKKYSLDEVATYILEQATMKEDYSIAQSLIRLLQDHYQVTSKNINDEHKTIANIPWIRIYTTNYDDVFENAHYNAKGKDIATFNAYDDTSKVAKQKSIVHLNGYIRNLTVNKLNSEFKLATFSYWQEEFKRERMFELLKQDLDNSKAIIYIGTSLKYDFDISKILNTDMYRDKTVFVDREKTGFDISDSRKNHLGLPIERGVKGFAQDLQEEKAKFKLTDLPYDWRCFKPVYVEKNIYEENNVQHLWDLLVTGKINFNILQKNLNNDEYIISREELSKINPLDYKVINVHSNLGNGKTTSILKQAYIWSKHYRVFILKQNDTNISNDLMKISKIKEKKILIIEDYTFYQDVLKKIKVYLDGSYTLLLTSRSFVNEQYEKQIPSLLDIDEKDIKRINLNYLSSTELSKVSSLLQKLYLSKILLETKSQVKKNIIKNKQLSNILLDLLSSEPISNEIDKIYEKIEGNNKALQILCATMINNFVTLGINPSDLFSLVDVTTNDIENIRDEGIKEILNVGNGDVTLQSSVFARYLVSKKSIYSNLMSTMKKILMNSRLLSKEDEKRVCEKLISQSNIKLVFTGLESTKKTDSAAENVVRYFDDIVELRNHKDNIFFWLQYGMACMDIKQYPRSRNYLNISYELAQKSEEKGYVFETYQIDTQFARLLLEENIYLSKEPKDKINDFFEANSKLEKAIKQRFSQARLAYKQMILYKPFISKNLKYFSDDEIKKIGTTIDNHLKNKWFKTNGKENEEMRKILENCKQQILRFIAKN